MICIFIGYFASTLKLTKYAIKMRFFREKKSMFFFTKSVNIDNRGAVILRFKNS